MGNRLDIPFPEYPLEIVFVLVKPAFSGNIGAVCRGMLNFGFSKLRVIGHEVNGMKKHVNEQNMLNLY